MRFAIIFFTLLLSFHVNASKGYSSKQAYVEDWYRTAIQEMIQFKIPASITLAQGLLESSYGNSDLAKYANNHFGIKCSDWKGDTFYQDDDTKDECFRKYDNAQQSYEDHSKFLVSRSRYASLFDLKITDYKAWAHGLKKAGYATNPKYPALLIDLIESLNLDQYDKMGLDNSLPIVLNDHKKEDKTEIYHEKSTSQVEKLEKKEEEHTKLNRFRISTPYQRTDRVIITQPNKTKYIIAKDGDTFYKIAKEFELTLSQLHRYNDFANDKDYLDAGDIVYLQPKRSASKRKKIITSINETAREISQSTGVKISAILKKNNLASADTDIPKGKKIKL